MPTELEKYLEDKFVIAGTGSRSFPTSEPTEAWNRLLEQMLVNKEKHPDLVAMSGAAEGWDHAITLAARHYAVPYVLCIPNKGYGEYYWGKDNPQWNSMLEGAVAVEYTMEDVYHTERLYLPWPHQKDLGGYNSKGEHSNFVRNRRMVKLANAFWVYGPESRGTSHCLTHIKKAGKPFKILG